MTDPLISRLFPDDHSQRAGPGWIRLPTASGEEVASYQAEKAVRDMDNLQRKVLLDRLLVVVDLSAARAMLDELMCRVAVAGGPLPSLASLREEADAWARLASLSEARCYFSAIARNLTPEQLNTATEHLVELQKKHPSLSDEPPLADQFQQERDR